MDPSDVASVANADGPPSDLDLAIVILNYNTADLLRDCLKSVFASNTTLRFHVCVVDNASTDGSVAMVQAEFPSVHLIANRVNRGFSSGNNDGLRWYGFGIADANNDERRDQSWSEHAGQDRRVPRYALLLNPDTLVPPTALDAMVRFMDERPQVGIAGPRLRRLDGSLDRACRRSFPTPAVSFYRILGLSKLFPKSRRFNAYNLGFYAEDAVHPVDSVVGAFMLLRQEAIAQTGLLDEAFFMYGEDLDWAKRIKDAGWEVWYNGQVEITHVKEAASRQSSKSRIDFHEASWIFYDKHYRQQTNWFVDKAIRLGIAVQGGVDVARHLWAFMQYGPRGSSDTSNLQQRKAASSAHPTAPSAPAPSRPSLQVGADQ